MTIGLRPAVPADAEFLYELHRATLRDAVVATWGQWDEARQRGFHEIWFDPSRVWVVVDDGCDVGVLHVEVRADGTVYVSRFELLPQAQDLGAGLRLMQSLIADARRDGAPAIEVDVLEADEAARHLYLRLEFEVFSSSPPRLWMRLLLQEPVAVP